METWKNIKGFIIEMFFNVKGMVVDYCNEIIEPINEEICENTWCKYAYKIAFWFGVIASALLLGLILYYGIGMLFMFILIGLGLLLSIVLIGMGIYVLNAYVENKVIQIALFPLILLVVLCITYLFNDWLS